MHARTGDEVHIIYKSCRPNWPEQSQDRHMDQQKVNLNTNELHFYYTSIAVVVTVEVVEVVVVVVGVGISRLFVLSNSRRVSAVKSG